MDTNNWKAIVNVKEDMTLVEIKKANDLIEYWKKKLDIIEKSDGEFFQKEARNEMPMIVAFTHKLKNQPNLFSKISVVNLQSKREDRFL